jgi:hypothetical protein
MSSTIEECSVHARQCEWYAARTNDEGDRKFLIRRAQQWTKLAKQKEIELKASARTAAKRSVNPEPGFLFVAGQR